MTDKNIPAQPVELDDARLDQAQGGISDGTSNTISDGTSNVRKAGERQTDARKAGGNQTSY